MNLVRFTFPLLMAFLAVSSSAWSQETTDAATPELILKASLGGKAYPRTLRFSEDGSIVWVNTLDAWNVETGEKIIRSPAAIRKIPSPIIDIANKSMLIASRESGDLLLWLDNGQPTERKLSQSGKLSAARLFDDGKRFALVFPDPPSVYFGRVDTDKDDSITRLPFTPYRCRIAPNGNLLAIRKDREVTIWDLKRGEKKSVLVHKHEPYGFAFSPDSQILATGSTDNIVRLFNANDGKVLAEMSGHGRGDIFLPSAVYSLEFSPDGKRLASGGHDGRVIVWDVESHKPIMKVQIGGPPIVTAVSFSPDSASIACCFENAGSKRGVRVWRLPKKANIVDQLVGSWITTKIISGGKKQEVSAKLEFTAEKCMITVEGRPPETCSYSLKAEKSPKHMDLVFNRRGKTITLPAIFELEDGELKVSHPLKENGDRPKSMEPNPSNVLFHCKRQKPDTVINLDHSSLYWDARDLSVQLPTSDFDAKSKELYAQIVRQESCWQNGLVHYLGLNRYSGKVNAEINRTVRWSHKVRGKGGEMFATSALPPIDCHLESRQTFTLLLQRRRIPKKIWQNFAPRKPVAGRSLGKKFTWARRIFCRFWMRKI